MPREPHPHGKDLRKGRYSEEGRPYLLTSVTFERKPIFLDLKAGHLLAQELSDAESLGMVGSLAWVIMPDHLHWLVELHRPSLARLMQRVKSRSAIAINRHLGAGTQLWQRGFHDRALRRDEDVQQMARYVVANPLRKGLVSKLSDYPLWYAMWA